MTDDAIDIHGLPADEAAERLVLGVIETDSDALPAIFGTVEADDFSTDINRRVFGMAKTLYEAGEPVDSTSIARALMDASKLDSVGGLGYLVDLADLPRIFSLDSHLSRLRERAILRRAAIAAHKLANECCQPGASVEIVERAERFYRQLSGSTQPAGQLQRLGEFIEGYPGGLEAFLSPAKSEVVIPTPWPGLNETLGGGFRSGQMIVLAARPGLGKSAAAGQVAHHAAVKGFGVPVFSLEMATVEIWHRMLAAVGEVDLQSFRRGRLTDVDRYNLQGAASAVAELPLWVAGDVTGTVPAIEAAVRKHRASGHPVKLVIIDYLQLMQGTGARYGNRQEEVADISRSVKLMAGRLKLPVVMLAQLRRAPAAENREPQLYDLRESGAVEQDADVVMFLYQKQIDKAESMRTGLPCATQLIVRKQRNGPLRSIDCMFNARYVRLEETLEGGVQ